MTGAFLRHPVSSRFSLRQIQYPFKIRFNENSGVLQDVRTQIPHNNQIMIFLEKGKTRPWKVGLRISLFWQWYWLLMHRLLLNTTSTYLSFVWIWILFCFSLIFCRNCSHGFSLIFSVKYFTFKTFQLLLFPKTLAPLEIQHHCLLALPQLQEIKKPAEAEKTGSRNLALVGLI